MSSSSQPSSPRQSRRPLVSVEVMENILSRLPLSSLARFRAVSTSFLSTIRSLPATLPFPKSPLFFLFYSWPNRGHLVYEPSRDRWFFYLAPRFPTASCGSHFLITDLSVYEPGLAWNEDIVTVFHVSNPFSGAATTVPLPLRSSLRYHGSVLVFNPNSTFTILAMSVDPDGLEMYHSNRGTWDYCCEFSHDLDYSVNAVFLDGSLYVISRGPTRLLMVDPEAGLVSEVALDIPVAACRHMMVFEGRLFIVGWAMRQVLGSNVVRIEVWEFVRGEPIEWKLVDSMPDDAVPEFAPILGMLDFCVCSGSGVICFYHSFTDCLMTYDVLRRSWTRASTCRMLRDQRDVWVGCAVEPDASLLR